MKVMVTTTRRRVPPNLANRFLEQAKLPDDTEFHLLTVHPVCAPGFAAVHCVQPSVAPRRPVVSTGDAYPPLTGGRRVFAALVRATRRTFDRLPVPERMRFSVGRQLASACATSPDLHRLAAQMDVVVAWDKYAPQGLWELAKHVPDVAIVHRAAAIRGVLEGLGRELPPPVTRHLAAQDEVRMPATLGLPRKPEASRRLLIAPANYAGQAQAWASAAERILDDVTAMNFRAGSLTNPFPSDYSVDGPVFKGNLDWRVAWRDFVDETFTHVIVEANRPVFGSISSSTAQCVRELRNEGKHVALLSHGSDSRIPSVHAAQERWHQYDGLRPSVLARLEAGAQANTEYYNSYPDGPVYVSTPGLLAFVEHGTWLPLVVDPVLWARTELPMQREVPVVAHIPSNEQKGSHMIDPVLSSLAARGVIEYRRVEGVQYTDMPELYGTADIMVEQFGIADYSVAACEAMAAGRVVVSRVSDRVRNYVREQTGRDLPIVEANPDTLEQVILGLIADRDRARAVAAEGVEFVADVHDGRRSAQVLRAWLDSTSR